MSISHLTTTINQSLIMVLTITDFTAQTTTQSITEPIIAVETLISTRTSFATITVEEMYLVNNVYTETTTATSSSSETVTLASLSYSTTTTTVLYMSTLVIEKIVSMCGSSFCNLLSINTNPNIFTMCGTGLCITNNMRSRAATVCVDQLNVLPMCGIEPCSIITIISTVFDSSIQPKTTICETTPCSAQTTIYIRQSYSSFIPICGTKPCELAEEPAGYTVVMCGIFPCSIKDQLYTLALCGSTTCRYLGSKIYTMHGTSACPELTAFTGPASY